MAEAEVAAAASTEEERPADSAEADRGIRGNSEADAFEIVSYSEAAAPSWRPAESQPAEPRHGVAIVEGHDAEPAGEHAGEPDGGRADAAAAPAEIDVHDGRGDGNGNGSGNGWQHEEAHRAEAAEEATEEAAEEAREREAVGQDQPSARTEVIRVGGDASQPGAPRRGWWQRLMS